MTMPTFAALLRRHRDAQGLSQAALAKRARLNEETVRELERFGKRPRPATVGLLADALGLDDDQRAAFRAAAGGHAPAAGPPAAPEAPRPRGHLRRAPDSFLGRDTEVAAVRLRLRTHGLVTLTGPGGVGKTRLAVEAAHGLTSGPGDVAGSSGSYPDGVWLTELGALTDADLVPQVIAAAVGVDLAIGDRPADALAEALGERRLLLVLDNCEHLVGSCAEVVEALLGACPGVRVLATSREPLGCAGETVVRVASLAVPPSEGVLALAEVNAAAATCLFVDRASEVAPGFVLTGRNASAVAEVCRRLDGIPLALEFAARLVRGLPVEEIAARLDDRFRLLTGGRRSALSRQQTLRALVDWSYELLAPAEQALFVRLCIFAGPFTLEAAEAVSAGGSVVGAVLTPLLRLVDTSLAIPQRS